MCLVRAYCFCFVTGIDNKHNFSTIQNADIKISNSKWGKNNNFKSKSTGTKNMAKANTSKNKDSKISNAKTMDDDKLRKVAKTFLVKS